MNGDMEIVNVSFHDDGTKFIVDIEIRNPSERTLHVYASARKMQYDPATKVLRLQLSDRGLRTDLPGGIFMLPRMISVDPHGQAVITLSLPRFQTRLVAAAGGERQREPQLEQLPIHEAEAVEVEVSWSDKPFYADARAKKRSIQEQLVAWERGLARGRGGYNEPQQGPKIKQGR